MAYVAVGKASVGQLFTKAMYDIVRENMNNQSPPGLITAKGQMYGASAAQTPAVTAAPGDRLLLTMSTGTSNRLTWVGGSVPLGAIIIWSGSVVSIPTGWQLCNGTNGTPDLRDKFVVGAGSTYARGATGGAATINLAHTHTPPANTASTTWTHSHTQGSTGAGSTHSHTNTGSTGGPGSPRADIYATGATAVASSTHTHPYPASTNVEGSHTHTNPSTGSTPSPSSHSHPMGTTSSSLSASQDSRPPYYALCYIQRVL